MRLLTLLMFPAVLAAQSLQGLWEASIDSDALKLRMVLRLSATRDGRLSGTFDSMDQGFTGISISSVTVRRRAVSVRIAEIGASYAGRLNASGTEITGTWKQGGIAAPVAFKRVLSIPEERPQTPQPLLPYDQVEISVVNSAANLRLAGTLTLPRTRGPFPAVLLIPGSGPQDRDETIMRHRPFLVMADSLARNGIAVLRMDKRGSGRSTGNLEQANCPDFARDAAVCVRYLEGRAEIDPRHIGLIGHSEGGIIAPMAANDSPDIAFVILLGAPAVRGDQVIAEQITQMARLLGIPAEIQARSRALEERFGAILRQEDKPATARKRMRDALKEQESGLTGSQRLAFEQMNRRRIDEALTPDARFLMTYDPGPALRKLRCPVLALAGELDMQVSPSQNLPALAEALEGGGNTDYEIIKLPRLNHLFQGARTGSPSEYLGIPETLSPQVSDLISAWILRHTSR